MTRALLQGQFEIAWKLAAHHLPRLTDAACLWEPAPGSWTVRRAPDGAWSPDWADDEPDPPPTVTIGWTSWHLIWWWTSASAAGRGDRPPPRESIGWPGSATALRARLDDLAEDWRGLIETGDLDLSVDWPWPEPRPLGQLIAWGNLEFMKNIAEIGCVLHLYRAKGDRA